MARGRARAIIPLLIILAAAGFGVWYWHTHRPSAPTNVLTLYGNVDIRQVDLAFLDSERVATMLVEEGDAVVAGQKLATLDTGRVEPAVAQAQAQVAAQAQVVARLKAGSRPEEIASARANVAAAQADATNAHAAYKRAADLAAKKVVPQQTLDDATAARDAADAHLNAAQEALNLAVAGPRKEDIAAAEADLQADQAALDLAQRRLADAVLYAPADGIVRNRILEPGDMASPQRPAYTMALTDPIWVRAYVAEPDLGKIWPGMQAQVRDGQLPDQDLRRLGRLHLPHRRVHAEGRRDHAGAHEPRLPGARLRPQPRGRAAPRHAGHRHHRARPGPARRGSDHGDAE